MKKIRCHLDERSYSVLVGAGVLSDVGAIVTSLKVRGKVLVVTNRKIHSLYFSKLERSLKQVKLDVYCHLVPDSEKAKSEKELFRMYDKLLVHGFDRYSTIIALGGGVIGDVSAFCASTFMRGIQFINVPTTLLAQVDSAIGGKTAINLRKGKNLVGSFYQPKVVLSDVSLLRSLSKNQIAVSLTEVIKYGIIGDEKFFSFLEKNIDKALKGNKAVLEHMVFVSSRIKARVVEEDEEERSGLRAILNFGHTFAHGIEAACAYRAISHGEAVGLGMLAAGRLACEVGMFSHDACARLEKLIGRLNVCRSLANYRITTQKIYSFMCRDKKNKDGKIRLILPTKIGKVVVRADIPPAKIRKAIKTLFI